MATPDMSARRGTRIEHGVPTPPSDSENKDFLMESTQDSPTPSSRRKSRSISAGKQQTAQQSLSPEPSAKQSRSSSTSRQSNNDPGDESGQAKSTRSKRGGSSVAQNTSSEPVTPSRTPPKKSPQPSRPASSLGTPSTPAKDAKQQSASINAALAKKIKKPGKNTNAGINYILEADIDGKTLIKLGLTEKDCDDRMKEIKATCRPARIQVVDPGQWQIPHVKAAEKLIHEELRHLNHRFVCKGCSSEHREYFIVDIGVATEVTERWTTFCESEPWCEDGSLHPFWEHRLTNTMRNARLLEDHGHEARGKLWKAFVSASILDRTIFNISSISSTVRERFWQWFSLVQAFYTFFRLPGQVTLTVLLSLMAIMIIERDFWGKLAPSSRAFKQTAPVSRSPSKKSRVNESEVPPGDEVGEAEGVNTSEDVETQDSVEINKAEVGKDSKHKDIEITVIDDDSNDEDEPVGAISGEFDRLDVDSMDKGSHSDGGVSDYDASIIDTPTHPARKRRK